MMLKTWLCNGMLAAMLLCGMLPARGDDVAADGAQAAEKAAVAGVSAEKSEFADWPEEKVKKELSKEKARFAYRRSVVRPMEESVLESNAEVAAVVKDLDAKRRACFLAVTKDIEKEYKKLDDLEAVLAQFPKNSDEDEASSARAKVAIRKGLITKKEKAILYENKALQDEIKALVMERQKALAAALPELAEQYKKLNVIEERMDALAGWYDKMFKNK